MNRQVDVDELVAELNVGLNTELLPEIVEEIAELIGMVATMQLVKAYGGVDMRVPVGVADSERERELVNAIGEASARELMAVYGGSRLYIPRCDMAYREQRNLSLINAVNSAIAQGMSKTRAIQKLAGQFGMTERWAFKVLKEKACYLTDCIDDEQMDIFG